MKKSLKYQGNDLRNGFLIFYGFIILYIIISGILTRRFPDVQMNLGLSSITVAIFCFICYLSVYGENLRFLIQCSRTRKEIYLTTIIIIFITSAISAVFSIVVDILSNLIIYPAGGMKILGFTTFYDIVQGKVAHTGFNFADIFFTFCFIALASVIGLFIAVTFARASGKGRVAIATGFPILGVLILVFFSSAGNSNSGAFKFFMAIFGITSGNPYIGCLTMLVISGILLGIGYLITRKTKIQ